jgi:16S rRNA (adenine1518-N6/adenine1519-N6)-dimethyltransferase
MPKKPKLGQNFLVDDTARHHIADSLGDISCRTIVEIGPGHGTITDLLAAHARRLIAVEVDPSLAAELRFRFRNHPNVEVHEADILRTDLATLTQGESFDVVGNLPYYITSDILLQLFRTARTGTLERAIIMMQREVAERVAASPGTREFGLLAATAQLHASVETLFTLPPAAFQPPPNVYSTVLRLHFAPRFTELQIDPNGFDRFLHQVFAQKRKTLHNTLRTAGFDPEALTDSWPPALPPLVRAEALSLETLASIYKSLTKNLTKL